MATECYGRGTSRASYCQLQRRILQNTVAGQGTKGGGDVKINGNHTSMCIYLINGMMGSPNIPLPKLLCIFFYTAAAAVHRRNKVLPASCCLLLLPSVISVVLAPRAFRAKWGLTIPVQYDRNEVMKLPNRTSVSSSLRSVPPRSPPPSRLKA